MYPIRPLADISMPWGKWRNCSNGFHTNSANETTCVIWRSAILCFPEIRTKAYHIGQWSGVKNEFFTIRRRFAQWPDVKEAPKPNLHPRKIMVSVWWSAKGAIHFSFLRWGESINAEKYYQEIDAMYEKLRIQQPALINRHDISMITPDHMLRNRP